MLATLLFAMISWQPERDARQDHQWFACVKLGEHAHDIPH